MKFTLIIWKCREPDCGCEFAVHEDDAYTPCPICSSNAVIMKHELDREQKEDEEFRKNDRRR